MEKLRCRLKAHNPTQLELKTRYPIERGRKCRYELDLYTFSPAQLRLNAEHYGSRTFLHDLTTYTRHSTPTIPFARLVKPDCLRSPITRIKTILDRPEGNLSEYQDPLLYEIRTLVNISRVEFRSMRLLLSRELSSEGPRDVIVQRLKKFLSEADDLIGEIRGLMPRFLDPHVPELVRSAVEWADEAISLNAEREYFKFWSVFSRQKDMGKARKLLAARLDTERTYRKKAGYRSVQSEDDPSLNEEVIYRESVLKKWSQSAMYMSSQYSKTSANLGHILAAVAAAAAMSFAVLATFLAERLFASYSVPWALMIVVAYIFKDRIKEVLRTLLANTSPRLFADRTDILIDPAGHTGVGIVKSLVSFENPASVPVEISSARYSSRNPLRRILPQENVLRYKRLVYIRPNRLLKYHTRLESITEIIRLNIEPWLTDMDIPKTTLPFIRDGNPVSVEGRKVYHIHLILRFSRTNDRAAPVYHYRIDLTKNGIIRIRRISGGGGG